jgi:hypothetical protein
MRALILGSLLLAGVARADGGVLRLSQASGPFVISLFTAPEPLRTGRAEVSVLVQARGTVVLDAAVELRVRAPDGTEQTLAVTHAAANNQLLQSAFVELRTPGRWALFVTARQAGAAATVSYDLDVPPATASVAAHWVPLALPALCILLFVWRERLLRQRGLCQPPCAATRRSASVGPHVPGS